MPNRVRREALRGAEKQTLDLMSRVFTLEQWSELLKAPLERAAARGKRALARKLVRAGASIGNALHAAVWGGHVAIVNDLLKIGASFDARDVNGRTPLHFAALKGTTEIVQLLLSKGAQIDVLDDQEWTPLYTAVCHGSIPAALALLAAGADVGIRCGAVRGTPVHKAAELGQTDFLLAALEQHGADVDACDTNRCTALHGAASENRVEAIDVLVRAGANVGMRSRHGMQPLHSAAGQRSIDAVSALLERGADVNAMSLNLLSPLMVAATKAGAPGAAETVDLLLRSGANETIVDEDGNRAADVVGRAVEKEIRLPGDVERVRQLLANAPADRAWRRRGYLVLCRAHPERLRPPRRGSGDGAGGGGRSSGPAVAASPTRLRSSRAKLPRVETAARGGMVSAGGIAALGRTSAGGWSAAAVAVRVLTLEEEGIFRTIVGYL